MFCLRILQCSCPELRFLYLHLRLVETLFNALMLAPSTIPVKPSSTPHMQYFGELPISAPCGLPGHPQRFFLNVCTRLPHVWNRGFPTGILTKPRVAQFIANFHHLNIHKAHVTLKDRRFLYRVTTIAISQGQGVHAPEAPTYGPFRGPADASAAMGRAVAWLVHWWLMIFWKNRDFTLW